ncbi:MAG TPA: hypothetical protein VFJ52_03450, partial [Terriglobia bacterium]|nr:hypothetical protein [Terriglobia bacterium]
MNIHFTDAQPGEMEELAATGFHWVRTDLNWAQTEHAKGQYDFSAYDRLMASMEPDHLRLLLVACYTNKLYDHGLSPYTDAGRQAFARWVVAAARHFRGRGVVWEIYNEPNSRFWKPKRNDENYIRLALTVGEALKENAPDAVSIGPAAALIDLPFLEKCFQAGLLNYWDAVSVHPYRMRAPETAAGEYAALRKLITKYAPPGKKIPILAGEWGYPGTWLWNGMSNVLQGHLLTREFLWDAAEGVPMTVWYDWRDDGADPLNMEDNFGLVKLPYHRNEKPVFSPKPAYFAMQTLSRVLKGYRFSKRLRVGTPDDYVLLFDNGKGGAHLAAWTAGWQPDPIVISGARGRFRVIRDDGAPGRKLHARRNGLSLTLTDAPVYLIP